MQYILCGFIHAVHKETVTSYFCGKDNSIMQKELSSNDQGDVDPRILKIAEKIKKLRIDKGYSSHEAFAYDHDLNRVQYWRIEKGANITIKTLLSVLDIHKISLAEFFKDFE